MASATAEAVIVRASSNSQCCTPSTQCTDWMTRQWSRLPTERSSPIRCAVPPSAISRCATRLQRGMRRSLTNTTKCCRKCYSWKWRWRAAGCRCRAEDGASSCPSQRQVRGGVDDGTVDDWDRVAAWSLFVVVMVNMRHCCPWGAQGRSGYVWRWTWKDILVLVWDLSHFRSVTHSSNTYHNTSKKD